MVTRNIKKNSCKTICTVVFAVCIFVIFSAGDCFAYLDPSAGGWLYQLLFPVIVAISGACVVLQRHIRELWRRFFSDNQVGRLTGKMRAFLARDNVLTLTMLPAIFAGVILPIEFLSEANGYLGYMRIWELFPVFGWQWLFFAFAGLTTGILILLCFAAVAKIFKISTQSISNKTLVWLSVLLCLLSFLRGSKLWLESAGVSSALMFQLNGLTVMITAIICVIWINISSYTANHLIKFAKFVAFAGFVLTVMAPVVTWIASPVEGALPIVTHSAESSKRPNIILVTVDSLTATHMSLYGYGRPTTPNLESLAKEANVYERFYANSNFTNSSISSILHGVRPWTHRSLQLPGMPLKSAARDGLVAKLKAAGYQTSAIATNSYAAPHINLTDQYFDQVAYGQINRLSARLGLVITRFKHLYPLFKMLNIDVSLDKMVDPVLVSAGMYSKTNHFDPERAFSSLRKMLLTRKTDRPSFSWIHLYAPHSPYATPAPFMGKFDQSNLHSTRFDSTPPWCYEANTDSTFPHEYVGRYDESVAYVDSHIGRFIDWLKAQGIYDDALIIVSSDHGESFSHGYGAHSGPAMHEDLIHVPLIIKEPKQHKGNRIPFLSEQIDLMPTILEYAGVSAAAGSDGVSLVPSLRLDKIKRPVFSMNFQQNYSFGQLITGTIVMIQGEWKYVIYFGDISYPGMPILENSLYNLRSDPAENFNLVSSQPAIANDMKAAIATQLREHGRAVE